MALVLVAALGATAAGRAHPSAAPIWPLWLWGGFLAAAAACAPVVFAPDGFGRLLQPLTVFHPKWVGDRIEKLTGALARFRDQPGRAGRVLRRRGVRPGRGGRLLLRRRLRAAPERRVGDLAVIVPMSFVVQMLPVSVNGFGVREATFSFYFTRIGLPIESAAADVARRPGARDAVLADRRGGLHLPHASATRRVARIARAATCCRVLRGFAAGCFRGRFACIVLRALSPQVSGSVGDVGGLLRFDEFSLACRCLDSIRFVVVLRAARARL